MSRLKLARFQDDGGSEALLMASSNASIAPPAANAKTSVCRSAATFTRTAPSAHSRSGTGITEERFTGRSEVAKEKSSGCLGHGLVQPPLRPSGVAFVAIPSGLRSVELDTNSQRRGEPLVDRLDQDEAHLRLHLVGNILELWLTPARPGGEAQARSACGG